MTTADRARQPRPEPAPTRAGAGRGTARSLDPLSASILALHAHAGNSAVAEMLAQREPAGGAVAADSTPPVTPPTTVAEPPAGGKAIERLGVVDNDTAGGGGLNLRATPGGAVLTRLAHNDHVMVKTDVGNDWVYLVATDGAARGTAGYASRVYVNTDLPPDPAAPDPGAILYRIQAGERAHDFVRRHYGAANIVAGQDQRFFTNVLQFVNEKAGRGRFFVKKMKLRGGGGGLFGSIARPYEDIELVAGGKIWVPSLPYAQALKGTVSAGSTLRDVWEKVKDVGEKLAAIPVFIAGLVVGMLESLKDLVVGLFELLWGLVKSAGGILVDMAKSLWGLVTDPRMRQALLDSIDEKLREMLYTGGLLKRAFNWGRIIGYMSMEVIASIVTVGAVAALKAGKFGARLAKLFETLKKAEAIEKAMAAAQRLKKTEAALKIASRVEKMAVVGSKAAEKVAPLAKGTKKVVGGIGKVLGLPGEALLGSARVLTKAMRKIAAKYGWSESRLAAILGVVEQRGATVFLRKSSKWAPARLAEGAAPKPLAIKANTLDELDLILSGGQFTEKHLGLVAHFDPLAKGQWAKPRGMSEKKWKSLQSALEEKYRKRSGSFNKNDADMKKLTTPSATPDSVYFELVPGNKVKGGLVVQVEVDDAGKLTKKPLTGDIDVFEFRTKKGELAGPEYEMLDDLFLEMGASEHGAHMAWKRRGDYNEDAFFSILDAHLKDPVVQIAPGGKVREITADKVPGVADVLASPEYKAWKAKKTSTKR